MKKLRSILLLLPVLAACQSHSANAQALIGKIDNSVAVLTANKTTLITNFSNNLSRLSGINGNFTDVAIVQDGSNYYLVFTGMLYRSSLALKTGPGSDNTQTLIYEDDGGGGGHVTCTTSDCASEPRGCVPSPVGLSCTPCANKGKCTKTVSATSLLGQ